MPEENDEEWMKYASAGFGQTNYSLWEEDVEEEKNEPEAEQLGIDLPEQLATHMEEIPRAPNPAGLKHLVRIGCCDFCLGRLGGKKRYEQTIEDSGVEIRQSVVKANSHLANIREEIPLCPFCENLFEETELLADIIYDSIKPYEIKRLQIGTRFPKDQIEAEDIERKRYAATGSDGLKTGLVAEIVRNLNQRLEGTKIVNEKPHVLALIDVLTLTVELDIRAHYIYGRYRKLERGIPQTRWPCRACKGRGCEKCNYTGLQYESSVQDLIGNPILEVLDAHEHSFHGMGREDIDVRCMGRGRPFVIELKEPKLRSCDYQQLENLINEKAAGAIEVSDLRNSNRSEVVRIKDTPAEKSYTIRFKLQPMNESEYTVITAPLDLTKQDKNSRKRRPRRGDKRKDNTAPLPTEIITEDSNYNEEDLSKLKKAELEAICVENNLKKAGKKSDLIERILAMPTPGSIYFDLPNPETIKTTIMSLEGTKLAQRTPDRVAHRRADLIRRREVVTVHEPTIEVMEDGSTEVEVTLRCESGTYVKETIHGDNGRTQPSVASLLKAKCEVMWLDVGDIHAD
jgi:tRNA pseudouridine synthase 10|tara:strand:- start:3488 stop:5197 length:1710 start_codon:yes stop_codon:yes gene_type:complete